MGIQIERGVVDPRLWLAHADLQNNHAFGIPFVENIFRTINPIRKVRISAEMGKNMDYLARGIAFALLLHLTLGVLSSDSDPDGTNNKGDLLEWKEIQLSFNPDKTWMLVNCDDQGRSRGTGFTNPDEFEWAQRICKGKLNLP